MRIWKLLHPPMANVGRRTLVNPRRPLRASSYWREHMNALRTMVCAGVTTALLCPVVVAADAGACNYTAADRANWATSLARELRNHDPDHGAQMSKVASEIVNGQVDLLKIDISAGLNPNGVLKLTVKPVGHMSLLTLAVAACQETMARQLVASGASVDGAGASPPLVTAAAKGEASLAQFLIQHGATVDKVDENGHTARRMPCDSISSALSKCYLSTVVIPTVFSAVAARY